MEEDIKILETVVNYRKFDGIYSTTEVIFEAIEKLLKEYKELEEEKEVHAETISQLTKECKELREENKRLKAAHIITHNKVSIEEKAKLFDVIDTTIDTYLEKLKPYWEQIMVKDKMTIEEAEIIIDDMYQDKNKILRKAGETEKEVIFDVTKLDEVYFTNLEFASVRALREIQSLRRKLEKTKSLIKEEIEELKSMKLECCTFSSMRDFAILILEELLNPLKNV